MGKMALPVAVTAPIVTIGLSAVGLFYAGKLAIPKLIQHQTTELLKEGKQDTMGKLLLVVKSKFPFYSSNKIIEIATAIDKGSTLYGIPKHVILGIIEVETGGTWKTNATSSAGAIGLMGIMPSMGRVYMRADKVDFTSDRLADPALNISIGINMLADAYQMHVDAGRCDADDYTAALHTYNNGPRPTVELYSQKNFNPKSLWYPNEVMERAKKYKDLGL